MTATSMTRMFLAALEANDDFYTKYEQAADHMIRVYFSGENLNEIIVYANFSTTSDGTGLVTITNYNLPNFDDKYGAGVLACNEANDEELVKFYLDEDNDVVVQSTLMFNAYGLSTEFSPMYVVQQLMTMALSIDDAYPIFAKAKWS